MAKWTERLLGAFVGMAQPPAGKVADQNRAYEAKTATTAGGAGSSKLPDPGEPKVKAKSISVPSMFNSAKPDTTSALRESDRGTANLDLTTLRNQGSTKQNVEVFARVNPELSAAVDAYLRVGLTKPKIAARDRLTGLFNPEATKYLHAWMAQQDQIGNYVEGFSPNIHSTSLYERLGLELRYYGACSLELVLNAARQPDRFQPLGVRSIKWYPDKSGKWTVPLQTVGGVDISLDIPTFFYTSLDQSLYTAFSESPLEPALQPVLFGLQFLNDVRRVIRTSVHPRTTVSISQDELFKLVPPEVQVDAEELLKFFNTFIDQITERINGLEPEEALVFLDTMEVDILDRGNTSLSAEYDAIMKMADGKTAAGAKTLPSVLGKGGNQAAASVESILFIKSVAGAIQRPIERVMGPALTMAARLAGFDVAVDFTFNPINLRPEAELAGFRAQEQAITLELHSLGFLTDEEASMELLGRVVTLPTPLSGTMYYKADASAAQNNYSGTSVGGDGGGGSQNEALTPKTSPNKAGDNKGKK